MLSPVGVIAPAGGGMYLQH